MSEAFFLEYLDSLISELQAMPLAHGEEGRAIQREAESEAMAAWIISYFTGSAKEFPACHEAVKRFQALFMMRAYQEASRMMGHAVPLYGNDMWRERKAVEDWVSILADMAKGQYGQQ